ncbi:MAG: hypothetical protein Q4A12_04225 [Eubacteriales bacterium]|nr:hypothetical protein [Eubacteriales bacterium]
MDIYRIADLNIEVKNHSEFTKNYLADYLTDELVADFSVTVTQEMIAHEKEIATEVVPEPYYEITAILRYICDVILSKYSGFFLHCSCLELNGEAYVFTAKSGTGKSTHAKLWREVFKDKVTMINDDKPIVRILDDKFYIYGTPWNGKHSISNNIKAPIKAIFYLHQADSNRAEMCDPVSAITKLLSQTVLPDNKEVMNKLLNMIEQLVSTTPMYDLYCTISEEAVHTAYNSVNEI